MPVDENPIPIMVVALLLYNQLLLLALHNLRASQSLAQHLLALTEDNTFVGTCEDNLAPIIAYLAASTHAVINMPNVPWDGRRMKMWYVKPRSLHWWENYLAWCEDDNIRFRSFFRVPQPLFEHIANLVRLRLEQGPIPEPLLSIRGRRFPVERKVAIALLRLATGCSLELLSEIFGCGISTASRIVDEFVDALLPHMENIIRWPQTPLQLEAVKSGMQVAMKLPNCCGAIDCTHICMECPPHENTMNWYDRKGKYSMTLQGIVDHNMRFLDIFVGFPGPANDKRVLQNSSFFRLAQANQILNGPSINNFGYSIREYIIGDGGYCQLPLVANSISNTSIKF